MERRFDVCAIGEMLIDFTEYGVSEQGNPLWEANPGGAPCNVLAMLNKLGRSTAFIGKIGRDVYGDQLRKTASDAGIDTTGLLTDERVHTTLAIVHRLENGDRDFSFYRDPGADMMLTEDELPVSIIENCRIFHFGSLSMTHKGIGKATERAISIAKNAGALISFDPNLRPPLWPSLEMAKERIAWGLAQCDILKIADNELEFMTGETDFDSGAAALKSAFPNIKLLNVTAGAEGSYCYYNDLRVFMPAFKLGGTIETTGAGDTFGACVLNDVLENGVSGRGVPSLENMLRFANAAAYIVTTRRGVIRSLPERGEIEALTK